MEFDDFFGNRQQNRRFDHDHNYQENFVQASPYRSSYHRRRPSYKWTYFMEVLKVNRKLKTLAIIVLLAVLAIIVVLIVVFLPLILKLYTYISQNGVQGVMDVIVGFLDQLWRGTGN